MQKHHNPKKYSYLCKSVHAARNMPKKRYKYFTVKKNIC